MSIRLPRESVRGSASSLSLENTLETTLENKFQPKLQNARQMSSGGAQIGVPGARGVTGREISPAIASDLIGIGAVAGVIRRRPCIAAQPGIFHMIEHVEGFGAELKVFRFG